MVVVVAREVVRLLVSSSSSSPAAVSGIGLRGCVEMGDDDGGGVDKDEDGDGEGEGDNVGVGTIAGSGLGEVGIGGVEGGVMAWASGGGGEVKRVVVVVFDSIIRRGVGVLGGVGSRCVEGLGGGLVAATVVLAKGAAGRLITKFISDRRGVVED